MTMQEVLETTGLPVWYFTPKGKKLPARYLVWYGNGQNAANADDTLYFRKNGYVAEYKSAEDFANGIYWTLSEGEYQSLSEEARRKVTTSYSESSIAKKYIEIYNKIIRNNE